MGGGRPSGGLFYQASHFGVAMSTSPSPNSDWKNLFRAAILETDRAVLPVRILEAEQAVLARERELFFGIDDAEELEELEDALYALQAYKSASHLSGAA
jgi:hypothetical protein